MDSLIERAKNVIGFIECEVCGHSLDLHEDLYGCEYERGDREGDESGPAYALPPCGCKAPQLGDLSDDGNEAFMVLRDLTKICEKFVLLRDQMKICEK